MPKGKFEVYNPSKYITIKKTGILISIENDYAYIISDGIIVKRCYDNLNVESEQNEVMGNCKE